MIALVIFTVVGCVSGQQFVAAGRNQSSARSSNLFNNFPASRQFQVSGTDHYVEQYKQNVGYTYGPPPKSPFSHDNRLHIYLFQNKLSIYCATDTTYERITWRKFTCPNQIGSQAGEVIAVGPVVTNTHLYGVNSFGRNEEYVSELLLKQPLTPNTDGVYVCEGTFITDSYPQDTSMTTIRDVIIIGGKGMYQNCFAQFCFGKSGDFRLKSAYNCENNSMVLNI